MSFEGMSTQQSTGIPALTEWADWSTKHNAEPCSSTAWGHISQQSYISGIPIVLAQLFCFSSTANSVLCTVQDSTALQYPEFYGKKNQPRGLPASNSELQNKTWTCKFTYIYSYIYIYEMTQCGNLDINSVHVYACKICLQKLHSLETLPT